ncbi:hypothetical protein ACFQ6H_21160 [Rhodococcus sp. NPDC056506]|uniref:hypothetical protein n=1 Tax=Rhodococcus sp. NPDC056506 TaxID=3345844 RepID=UPI00366AEA55
MTDSIARAWDVCDAVLKWAYISKFQYGGGRKATAEDVTAAVEWAASPLTPFEVDRATIDLKDHGYLTGTVGMLLHTKRLMDPRITVEGMRLVDLGRSVRPSSNPLPANPSGVSVTNVNTFNNHGPSNNAVNSSGFTQNIAIEEKTSKILAVADALDAHGEGGHENAEDARETAVDLRALADEPEVNKSKLRELLIKSVSAFALAAGTSAGQQSIQLASSALQVLG